MILVIFIFNYLNVKNKDLHLILNKFMLKFSKSSGILLFRFLNLFDKAFKPFLLLYMQQKWACMDNHRREVFTTPPPPDQQKKNTKRPMQPP
jgi:hypothetical protein